MLGPSASSVPSRKPNNHTVFSTCRSSAPANFSLHEHRIPRQNARACRKMRISCGNSVIQPVNLARRASGPRRPKRAGRGALRLQLVDELGSRFADGLHHLMLVGTNVADGSSVYPNVPKGLGRAGQLITSLVRSDRAHRRNTTDSAPILEFELIQGTVFASDDALGLGHWKDGAIWECLRDGLDELLGVDGLAVSAAQAPLSSAVASSSGPLPETAMTGASGNNVFNSSMNSNPST